MGGKVTSFKNNKKDSMVVPGRGRTEKDNQVRKQFAAALIRENPRVTKGYVYNRVKEEYGVGITGYTISKMLKKERGVSKLPRGRSALSPNVTVRRKNGKGRTKVRSLTPVKNRVAKLEGKDKVETTIRAAMDMVIEEVPTLKSLEFEVLENGTKKLRYKVQSVYEGEFSLEG